MDVTTIIASRDSSDRPVADSVRLAWPNEAAEIAALQRRAWAAQLPADLAQTLLASVSDLEMTEAWHAAITRPPRASYRVLVAVERGRVVGFASTMPSPDEDGDPAVDGQIEEFVVDPAAQQRGHGSRLLNACADTLRSDGFRRAYTWVGRERRADPVPVHGRMGARRRRAGDRHRRRGRSASARSACTRTFLTFLLAPDLAPPC